MKKQKAFIYKCSSCGKEEPKWLGRCPECGEWNTFLETTHRDNKSIKKDLTQTLPLISIDPMESSRIGSGISELDRVLGGGIMRCSSILVGGEPGIGKSTLLMQVAASVVTKGRILYVSGEESAGQLRLRADRLGISKDKMERIEILCSGNLHEIETALNNIKPVLVVVDSAQTLYSERTSMQASGAVSGTVSQMKYCSFELISWAKEHDAALFLTAHVTKEGVISGPKMLEHMVDTVIYFEQNDKTSGLSESADCRFLRAVKNRFGSVDEIGIFTMGEQGLSPVEDTGRMFLVRRAGAAGAAGADNSLPSGVATAAVLEGSRTILVEIQALTIPAKSSISRVFSDKIDSGRVSRISAALEKYLGIRLSDQDLYVNAAGGMRITEVGVELAIACAIYSARTGLVLPADLVIAGELSLTGEIRPVRRLGSRVKTAMSLGFNSFLGPVHHLNDLNNGEQPDAGLKTAKDIKAAIKLIYGN